MRQLLPNNLVIASACILLLMAVAISLGLAYGMLLLSLVSALSVVAILRWIRIERREARARQVSGSPKADGAALFSLSVHMALVLMNIFLGLLWLMAAVALLAQGNPRLGDFLGR